MRLSARRSVAAVVAGLAATALVWSGSTPSSAAEHQRTTGAGAPNVSPARPIMGERTTFSGRVPASAPRPVRLQSHASGTWRVVASGRTSATGRYAVSIRAPRSTSKVAYRVVAPAVTTGHRRPAVTSAPTSVAPVRQKGALTGPDSKVTGGPVTLRASFTPVRRGRAVTFAHRTDQGWTVVGRTTESRTGQATWRGTAPSLAGPATYRAVAVSYHGAAAVKATHRVALVPAWRAPTLLSRSTGYLTHVSCATSTFCVGVDDTGNATTYDGTSWSTPTTIDTRLRPSDVSCPSTSFCAAVDDHGFAMTFDGTHWSKPVAVDPGGRPIAVSCTSATFCVAVGFGGAATTYDGTSWSSPVNVAPSLGDVSCPATGHCVALDFEGHSYSFDGTSWSASTTIAAGQQTNALSCATTTFCVAVDLNGNAYTYNGTTWSGPVSVGGQLVTVSCTSTTFCATATLAGSVRTFNGASWSDPATSSGLSVSQEISCSSGTACALVGRSGAAVLSGTTWTASQPDPAEGGLVSVSCVDQGFCRAVDHEGNVYGWNGTAWSAPVPVDSHGTPTAISCRSHSLCALVDDAGWAMTYDGTSWGSATHVQVLALRDVSCPVDIDSADWCDAVGDGGAEHALVAGAWAAGTTVDDQDLVGVSCATSNWCVAVDDGGRAVRYDHGVWSAPSAVTTSPLEADLSVSCPVVGFCAATAQWGGTWTYDGTTWTDAGVLDSNAAPWSTLRAVSCASASFCVLGLYGGLSTYDGTSWTTPDLSLGTGVADVSCPTTTFCAVVDTYGDARLYR